MNIKQIRCKKLIQSSKIGNINEKSTIFALVDVPNFILTLAVQSPTVKKFFGKNGFRYRVKKKELYNKEVRNNDYRGKKLGKVTDFELTTEVSPS